MKKYISILFLLTIIVISCKKTDNIIPIAAPQAMPNNLYNTKADFMFLELSGNVTGGIPYYYLPKSVKVNADASKLAETYKWYLIRNSVPDSLLSTEKNPTFTFSAPLSNSSIKLITQNKISIDSISKPFELRSTPNGLKISAIVIDTMPFHNPANGLFWNGTNGANLFCQIFSGTSIVMDTLNGTGWSSAPGTVAGIYPVKTNLDTTALAYPVKYPNSIKTFTISSAITGAAMTDTFKVKLFNKNTSLPADLIGEANLTPSIYFGGTLPTTIYIRNAAQGVFIKLTVSWI